MVQMTTEQLQQLIESLRPSAASGVVVPAARSVGSFSNCSSRFGGERDHEAVEEFITSIVTYKEVESISDENALKGISLLFYGLASTWWQGVRREAKTWFDVLALIRDHFSPTKPAYQIYLEIFDKKQDDKTAIDTFVCQKRALLAQLPEGRHDEETEIDLVYGLLNIKYRKQIARYVVKTFRELLEKGRIIEHNSTEAVVNQQAPSTVVKRTTQASRCRKRKNADNDCNNGDETV